VTVEVLASARAILEASRGAGGTPTRLLYFRPGAMVLNQGVGTISPTEAWAKFAPYRRHYAGLETSGFTMAGDVTFDDFIWQLNLGVKAVASGTGPTDTSAYTWTFLPTETSDDLKSTLIQFAYADFLSTWGGSLAGCIINKLTVHWTKNVADDETGVSYTAELMSAYGVTQITAFTGSLTDRAITSAVGPSWTAFMDTTTIGSTSDTRILEATYTLDNGYQYRYGADGTNHAVEIVRGAKRMSSLSIQRYFNSKTELDAMLAKTTRKVRLLVEGPLAGAASVKNTVKLDYYGVPESHDVTTVNGLIYANIMLRPVYDTSVTSDHQWVVINTTASIT
jgi:hypothetical protein